MFKIHVANVQYLVSSLWTWDCPNFDQVLSGFTHVILQHIYTTVQDEMFSSHEIGGAHLQCMLKNVWKFHWNQFTGLGGVADSGLEGINCNNWCTHLLSATPPKPVNGF
jgi:hypothetical protein